MFFYKKGKIVLLETERYLLDCSFDVGALPQDRPKSVNPIKLVDFLPKLKAYADAGKAKYVISKSTVIIRLSKVDISEDTNTATFLFQYVNKNGADPAFGNVDTGATRTEKKKNGEGISTTAHLVISLTPVEDFPFMHLAVLEEVPALTKVAIGRALNYYLRACTEYTYVSPETENDIKLIPHVKLELNAESDIEQILKGGKIKGFVAKKRSVTNVLDEETQLRVQEESLTLASKKVGGDLGMKVLNKAREFFGQKRYPKITIQYEDGNKRSTSFEMATNLDDNYITERDDGTKFFARPVKVRLDDIISQSESEIHLELEEHMIKLLEKNSA